MKDDHMRNSQLKPGYNIQIGAESEYVTGVGVFQDRNDTGTLIPFLENIKSNLGIKYKNVIADSGYESEENYLYLEEKDEYICHNNKRLTPVGITKRTSATGYISEVTVYECEDCNNCSYKSKCTKALGNRRNL